MSAIVLGKRSIFEENINSPTSSSSAASVKRIRFCSSSSSLSPPRSLSPNPFFSSPSSSVSLNHRSLPSSHLIEQLAAVFPDMDKELLEKALEECGDDLDSAIKSLTELRLGSADNGLPSAGVKSDVPPEADVQAQAGTAAPNAEVPNSEDPSVATQLPMDGAEWVELFVREMMSASNIDDARARSSRALEVLEKSICARAGAEAAKNFHQENMMLKEQVQALLQENALLKKAVTIQYERQKEFEGRNQELQHLKQLVSQYQEQLRTLEVNNYALTMHLKQAQQSNSIPGRFHPDVF